MDENKLQADTKKIIGKGRKALRYGVNIFVYTFVGIFMLLMVFFGVSQTSFFKNWLRDTVVEIVNDEIHGKLSIAQIDGTIFTSLLIKNVTLTSAENDTVVSAGNIELRTSPLKILFKNIYIRKFELKDAKIHLVEESDGELNLLKIFPSSDTPEDTTSSEFPFTIEVADFALTNVDLSMQRYDKVGSTQYYPNLNMDDLRIKSLYVSFNAFADLNKYIYRLTINNISFNPNFDFFQLQHLSGSILLTPNLTGINKLRMLTKNSDMELSAAVLGVDFLGDFSMEELSSAQVRFSLNASKINFDDFTTYIPPMEMLQGTVAAELEASGTFEDLAVKKLNLVYNNTVLNANAKLKNLLDFDKMNFDLIITNSLLDPADPNKLLRNIEMPEYKEFGLVKIDTLSYKGGPLDFKTSFVLTTAKGGLKGNANIDLRPAEMIYSAVLHTNNIDLGSIISIPTNINSEIKIAGTGFNPEKMKMDFSLDASSSKFGDNYFKNVFINSKAENGLITADLSLLSDSSFANLSADIDFKNPDDPAYEIKGKTNGINLARLLNNELLDSELNLSLDASGQGFNPDSMDLFLVTDIQKSRIMDFDIDSTRLILDLRRNDNGKKIVNIISDIADFTISGDFHLTSLGDVLSREADIIAASIDEKLKPIFKTDSLNNLNTQNQIANNLNLTQDFDLTYLLDFKEAMNLSFGKNQIELDGQMNGFVKSANDSLSISLNSDFDYLKFITENDFYFLINSKLNSKISNHLINGYTGNLAADIEFNTDRIYAGVNIYNLNSKLSLVDNQIDLDVSAKYEENINAGLNLRSYFTDNELQLNINNFNLDYNQFNIHNQNNLELVYSDETLDFENFILDVADGTLDINGTFGPNGDHKLDINLDALTGQKLVTGVLDNSGAKKFDADISLKGLVTGNFSDPKFSITASANQIKYDNSNFGSLFSVFEYENNKLNTDIRFLDSTLNNEEPAMLITGYIPLNLTYKNTAAESNDEIELTIESDEYDLSALKNVIPFVQFQKGKLETDIYISGTITKPIAIGYFSINDAAFKVTNNNLDYDLTTKVWIDDEDITIESIDLKNAAGTRQGGKLHADGFVKLNEFKLDSTFIKINGDLKVLDKISKSSGLFAYGDLVFQTRGDLIYSAKKGNSYVNLPIDVTVADLTVPLSKSAYSSSSGFIYKYLEDNENVNKIISELDSLILRTSKKDSIKNNGIDASRFDYTVDIKLKTEAEVTVVLSKELDQDLVAILGGDFFLESVNGKTKSGGELKLLEGSSLSFIKSFSASGNVKFDKITDPIIDITATYKDYYTPPAAAKGSSEQEVAVKIKLKGPLSELDKNFIKDDNNIGVYMGRQAIEEDKKDATKTATDAMYFLIIGKFPGDDNNQNDKNLVASTTTSLAGSLIGEVLNQYFDNYVTGFQLRQTATDTKFSLLGKVWKIKYQIGGSTEVLQDLSRANVKMEYPVTERLQLRLERKESENQQTSSINNPLFFESGFKYNFEF